MRLFRKKAEFGEGELKPFMAPEEWSQCEAVFAAVRPKRVLEWGSGGSTVALARDFDFIEELVSIEHNAMWHARVQSAVKNPRAKLLHVAPTSREPHMKNESEAYWAWADECEQDRSHLAGYVDRPKEEGLFDLALVDGRARVFCIEAALEIVKPGGVLIVHDAQREVYHPSIERWQGYRFIEPWSQGQVCVATRAS